MGVWLECVPNISEGRDPQVLEKVVAAMTAPAGVVCLKQEADRDHHRAVVTLAGSPEGIAAAAFAGIEAAVQHIDLRQHRGVHRRCGALDVCPFVPLGEADMALAVATAETLGARVAAELDLPVFLYAEAARRPGRRKLGQVRNHGFEGLQQLLGADPGFDPDFGPRRLHSSAGAVSIGARPFLIAYNINLASEDLALAQEISRQVRESDGGLPGVQAMGFSLEEQGCAQVSMNLLDHQRTSLRQVFDAVSAAAAARGVAVRESELIGLAPQAALDAATAAHIRLPDFDPERDLVEARLAACGL